MDKIRVEIIVRGGVVQGVFSNKPKEVEVLLTDYDEPDYENIVQEVGQSV